MSGMNTAHTAELPNPSSGSRGRGAVWSLFAVVCAIAAAGVGYLAGHSGGADLHKARIDGAQVGKARGHAAGAKRGYKEGFATGRKQGYDKAYKPAYDKAFRTASNGIAP